jgi:hypothetical protein
MTPDRCTFDFVVCDERVPSELLLPGNFGALEVERRDGGFALGQWAALSPGSGRTD